MRAQDSGASDDAEAAAHAAGAPEDAAARAAAAGVPAGPARKQRRNSAGGADTAREGQPGDAGNRAACGVHAGDGGQGGHDGTGMGSASPAAARKRSLRASTRAQAEPVVLPKEVLEPDDAHPEEAVHKPAAPKRRRARGGATAAQGTADQAVHAAKPAGRRGKSAAAPKSASASTPTSQACSIRLHTNLQQPPQLQLEVRHDKPESVVQLVHLVTY